jgi:hypothetical protein
MNIVGPARAGTAAGFLNTVRGAAEPLVIAVSGATPGGLGAEARAVRVPA